MNYLTNILEPRFLGRPLAVNDSVAKMVAEGEFGSDPAVCIGISPLRRADLAIKRPASGHFMR